jgi:hypothetical protein
MSTRDIQIELNSNDKDGITFTYRYRNTNTQKENTIVGKAKMTGKGFLNIDWNITKFDDIPKYDTILLELTGEKLNGVDAFNIFEDIENSWIENDHLNIQVKGIDYVFSGNNEIRNDNKNKLILTFKKKLEEKEKKLEEVAGISRIDASHLRQGGKQTQRRRKRQTNKTQTNKTQKDNKQQRQRKEVNKEK